MGSGKTCTLTGLIVDRARETACAIQAPPHKGGFIYPVTPFKGELVAIKGRDGETKIITIPRDYTIIPSAQIFTNYKLYGIKYVRCTVHDLFQWLNNDIIMDGILGIDESYIELESRRSGSHSNVILTHFLQQVRKRHLELYLLVQHGRFLDWRSKYIATREITCRFDERTQRVHLIIKNVRKNKERTISYWAPQYWRFFDTDETPEMPDKMYSKAISKIA